MNGHKAAGEAVILDPTGLHARPAVKLSKLAKGFSSAIEIKAGEAEIWVNAKSPNAVMKLKVRHGEILQLRADGEDAERAVDELLALIQRDFQG